MKKFRNICLLVGMVALLCSCKEKEREVPIKSNEIEGATYVSQGGPYGKLTVAVPEGWDYELCPVDSDELISGLYGIHIFPEGVEEGFIEIKYDEKFAVCGEAWSLANATIANTKPTDDINQRIVKALCIASKYSQNVGAPYLLIDTKTQNYTIVEEDD